MQLSSSFYKQPINVYQRISTLFLELLERQFPIDDNHLQVNFRSASDFANLLNVHVNHLNRAVKETMVPECSLAMMADEKAVNRQD